MNSTDIAWLVLRAVFAWMFLYPVPGLLRDWSTTVETTSLFFKRQPQLCAAAAIAVMVSGGIMVLLGAYGRVGAAGLCVFSLGGARVHYQLAALAGNVRLTSDADPHNAEEAKRLSTLAVVGHVTSAQKNFVLTAVAAFIVLMGTGPWSMWPS
mgnify:CR=1 FL=1